jgi:hypothetical protein
MNHTEYTIRVFPAIDFIKTVIGRALGKEFKLVDLFESYKSSNMCHFDALAAEIGPITVQCGNVACTANSRALLTAVRLTTA